MPLNQHTEVTPKIIYSASELEEVFLGSVIGGVIDGEWLLKIRRDVFFSEVTKSIFDACHKQFIDNGFVDFIVMQEQLGNAKGKNEAKQYLDRIIKLVPNEYSPSKTIEVLEETFFRRMSNDLLDRVRMSVQQNPQAAPELIFAAYEKINELSRTTIDFDLLKEFDEAIEEITSGTTRNVLPTGIDEIDKLVGGFSTREITIIGARPGHGKTTCSVGLALAVLDTNPNAKVVKFELEMSKAAIYQKFAANIAGVSGTKIRQNLLDADEKIRIREAMKTLEKYQGRLFVYDNVYNIHTMNKICRSTGCNLAMVDFLTLMEGIDENPRWELGRIMINAKKFAKAHNMSYLFFSQLNRGSEARDTRLPQASDISESDMVTQLASEVILLYYKYKYSFDPADKDTIRFIYDKSRYSSVGSVQLKFDPELATLTSRTKKGK